MIENNPTTGLVVWTPSADQVGEQQVILRVQDGRGGVDLQASRITVNPQDTAPVINSRPAGPALLSLTTGAPLCVSAVFTTPEGWHTRINAPVEIERTGHLRTDVTAMMRVVAIQFERFIAAAPADWHMFQPAWPDTTGPTHQTPPGT